MARKMSSRDKALRKLKEVLLRRRNALRQALSGDLEALSQLQGELGGDEVDFALDSAHQEMSSQLAELESRELEQIEAALERMENGTYGVCEITGKPIPLQRLQALPYTTVRVEAQRELERRAEMGELDDSDWGSAASAALRSYR